MSFQKAESSAATSGYYRWVGECESAAKREKRRRPKFTQTAAQRAVSSLDHAWLLEQARLQNEQSAAESAESSLAASAEYRRPAGHALCADIFERQAVHKARVDAERDRLRAKQRADREEARVRGAMANCIPVAHDRPFMPAPSKPGQFVEQCTYAGGLEGVAEYNTTKRNFLNGFDANRITRVAGIVEQSKHDERLNYLIVRHDSNS